MQDRYAGDVGDFLKYALLRWLVDGTPPARLGVIWYRVLDESHPADGKHVTYLRPGHAVGEQLRRLDLDLHMRMGDVVASGRSTAEVERSGALPAGTRFFGDVLTFGGFAVGDRLGRRRHRQQWLERALERVEGCDVVFADPDNGIRSADHAEGRHRDRSVKHAYVDELASFAAGGQTVVVYHHADRSAPVADQIQRRLEELRAGGLEPIGAVRASLGTTRLFLIAGTGHTSERVRHRLHQLAESPWAATFVTSPAAHRMVVRRTAPVAVPERAAAPLVKVVGFCKRHPNLTHEEYAAAHAGYHVSLGRRMRNLVGYLHYSWVDTGFACAVPGAVRHEPQAFYDRWDGFSELYFASYDAVHQFATVEHVVVPVVHPERRPVIVQQWVRAAPGLSREAMIERWVDDYGPLYRDLPGVFGYAVTTRTDDDVMTGFIGTASTRIASTESVLKARDDFYGEWTSYAHVFLRSLDDLRTFRIARGRELERLEREMFSAVWYREVAETVGKIPYRS